MPTNLKSVTIIINADWGRVKILDSNSYFAIAKPGYTSRASVLDHKCVMHKCSFSSQSIEVFKEKHNSDDVLINAYIGGQNTVPIETAHGSNGGVIVRWGDSGEVKNEKHDGGQNLMNHTLTL